MGMVNFAASADAALDVRIAVGRRAVDPPRYASS